MSPDNRYSLLSALVHAASHVVSTLFEQRTPDELADLRERVAVLEEKVGRLEP